MLCDELLLPRDLCGQVTWDLSFGTVSDLAYMRIQTRNCDYCVKHWDFVGRFPGICCTIMQSPQEALFPSQAADLVTPGNAVLAA